MELIGVIVGVAIAFLYLISHVIIKSEMPNLFAMFVLVFSGPALNEAVEISIMLFKYSVIGQRMYFGALEDHIVVVAGGTIALYWIAIKSCFELFSPLIKKQC